MIVYYIDKKKSSKFSLIHLVQIRKKNNKKKEEEKLWKLFETGPWALKYNILKNLKKKKTSRYQIFTNQLIRNILFHLNVLNSWNIINE